MSLEEFPGNSRRRVEEEHIEEIKQPKLERVVSGKVIKRKKPLGRRIKDTLFGSDDSSLASYLGKEVILPMLQTLITDVVKQGIDRLVYPDAPPGRSTNRSSYTSPRTHISYDRPSTIIRTNPTRNAPARRVAARPSAFDVNEIILESKIAAEMVMEKLCETLEEYDSVTVATLNDILGQTSEYTDHKWGWTNLKSMGVRRIQEGYLLILPEPEDLR